jgi:hypothetical protein
MRLNTNHSGEHFCVLALAFSRTGTLGTSIPEPLHTRNTENKEMSRLGFAGEHIRVLALALLGYLEKGILPSLARGRST